MIAGVDRYIGAGAELVETNTFGANRFKLAPYGLERRVRDINYLGARVAREAREIAGESVFVAGSVGPTGFAFRPAQAVGPEQLGAAYEEQVEALLEGGVDLLVFETFTDLEELKAAVSAGQRCCDLPIIAHMTFSEDLRTLGGQDIPTVVKALEDLAVDVLGTNCTVGPQGVLDVLVAMTALTRRPLSGMPNAGLPQMVEGRFIYLSSPAYFADYTARFREAGVTVIGGCCGTTPAHIAAMRGALTMAPSPPLEGFSTALGSSVTRGVVGGVRERTEEEDEQPLTAEAPTELTRKLQAGHFAISVELDPPKGTNPAKLLAGAAMLRDQGVDCINIGDSPMARVRMSALAVAVRVQQEVGLETIIHYTTRDRNLMAIQSDLIGAHALGVRNIIALTGDPPHMGDYPHVTTVWDVDSIGFIGILKSLNQGRDFNGNSIGRATSFFVACAVTPKAPDLEGEKERFRRKLAAGADLVMTQPLYTLEDLEQFLDEFGPIPRPVLLGVMPLQSYRHAEFLHHEVGGIEVPDHLRERMRLAGDRAKEEGLAITLEFITRIKGLVNGVYIMPSFGRYEVASEIVKVLRGM